jgi:hypothetical protein
MGVLRAAGSALQAQAEELGGDAVIVMPEDVAFVRIFAADGLNAKSSHASRVAGDWFGALGGVALEDGVGDGGGVQEGVVEDGPAGVFVNFLDVFGGAKADALIGLGHEVADEDAEGAGFAEGLGDAVDENVGDQAGEERARTDGDEVGTPDGFQGLGERIGVGGLEVEGHDAAFAGGDVGFAADGGAVVHLRIQSYICGGGGVDVAAGGKNLRRHLDGLAEVAGDAGERGQKEVAEAVALEAFAGRKAILEEAREQVLILTERDHAVAQIAGREHVEVFAEAAAGTAVVGDGDDGSEIGNFTGTIAAVCRTGVDMPLEAAQQGGEAGTSTHGDHANCGILLSRH